MLVVICNKALGFCREAQHALSEKSELALHMYPTSARSGSDLFGCPL